MPAKDLYHDTVKTALIKDGWTITKDPLTLTIGTRPALVNLGANKLFAAEKDARKIAVEIKSFLSSSPMNDLEKAIGQFLLYFDILSEQEPDRILIFSHSDCCLSRNFFRRSGSTHLETKTRIQAIGV